MKISDSIKYVGVNDHEIDLFEGQFEVPMGMAYNSYVILDDKIAEKFAWNIIPSGDIALNMLHLSTQVLACYEYLSNGPYREYEIYGMKLKFKHTTNRLLGGMSSKSALVIQAFKTLGEENITSNVLQTLKKVLTDDEKKSLLDECKRVPAWIYEYIKKIGV